MATSQIGRIIGVTSCKGGVGKSTVASSWRDAPPAQRRVGISDADAVRPCRRSWGDKRATPTATVAHGARRGWWHEADELAWGTLGLEADIDPRGGAGSSPSSCSIPQTALDDLRRIRRRARAKFPAP